MSDSTDDPKSDLARVAWWGFGALMVALALITVQKMLLGRDGDLHSFFFHASQLLVDGSWRAHGPEAIAYTVLPAALLPIMVLTPLPWLVAAVVWALVSVVCLTVATVVSARMAVNRVTGPTDEALVPVAALIGVGLVAASVIADLNLGQLDLLIVLLLAAAIRWLYRRPVACGLCLAMAASVKFVGLLFVPWLLLRRAWTQAIAAVLGFVALWGGGVVWLGFERASAGISLAFVGQGRLNLNRGEAVGMGESTSAAAGLHRIVERFDPSLMHWATVGLILVVGLFGLMLYRRAGESLLVRRLGERCALDHLEAVCIPALAISLLPVGHVRHGCMAIMATCVLAALLVTPGRRSGHLILLGVLALMVASQAHLADALGLDHAWDDLGGFGWTMLIMVLATTWTTLDRLSGTTSGSSGTRCRV